jgi:threonine/homoserine/homoserine lactone efflux protein
MPVQTLASLGYLAHGIGLGVGALLPLGPMKILCLRRVVAYGAFSGVVTAAGVVSGDAIFVAIAAFGLTTVSAMLLTVAPALRLLGGLALVYLAVSALRRQLPTTELRLGRSRILSMYVGTIGLTLSNPMTIVMLTSIMLNAGGLEAMGQVGGGLIAVGMVLGSILVWTGFTTAALLAGRHLAASRLIWLNRAAAALLLYFGGGALWAGLRPLL